MKEEPRFELELIKLKETDSTNNYVKHLPLKKEMIIVTADFQTAGRGQQGNSWESEQGANLTLSILFSPPENVLASNQFILSQAISLAIQKTLEEYIHGFCIKWPNDIYWNHKKIGGILIENELKGKHIERCIMGIGLNINQELFKSHAPNPTSLFLITEKKYNRDDILMKIILNFKSYLKLIEDGKTKNIIQSYHKVLYRNDGLYAYKDSNGIFYASIEHVEPQGTICLKDENGNLRYYNFKEVKFLLDNLELSN